jgi:predicted DNA-binding transcriptional regulator YafY
MSRPAGRVLTLLELLQSGGTRTMAELADRLGVDPRTVRRYIEHLIDLDVPVETVRGRYGGYRLAPGYRVPPLMFSDDEALAVLLGLIAGRRTGLTTAATDTATETALAKIRRVLPERLSRRLETVLDSLAFTQPPGESAAPDAEVLLTVADAVRHRRPVWLKYADREGRRSERTLHPHGVVAHAGRWYVTGADPGIGEARTLRLDRIAEARVLPGSFEPPDGPDPAERVLSGFATAGYRYEVALRIRGTVGQIRGRLPPSLATVDEAAPDAPDETTQAATDEATEAAQAATDEATEAGQSPDAAAEPSADPAGRWLRVGMRVERLDWLPAVLASLDLPFVVERPDELRALVIAYADRFAARARGEG